MAMRKGSYFFILDAFIGGTIIFFTLILLSNARVIEPIIHTTSFTSTDYIQILSTTKVRDFQNPYLTKLRVEGAITDSSITLLQAVINLKEDGDAFNASQLLGNFTPGIIPIQTGLRVTIDNDVLYSIREPLIPNAQSFSTSRTIMIDSINYNTHYVKVEAWA